MKHQIDEACVDSKWKNEKKKNNKELIEKT